MHVNRNMIREVLAGIEAAESVVGTPQGETDFLVHQAVALEMHRLLTPPGDRPFVLSGLLKAKQLARSQGFIAAYRNLTDDCGRCGKVTGHGDHRYDCLDGVR